jgi:hypothetical protein
MGRRPGPLDRGERISTLQLLETIEAHGPHWPAVLAGYTIEAVSAAVGREIMDGNLADGSTLTAQGRMALAALRAGASLASAPDLACGSSRGLGEGGQR